MKDAMAKGADRSMFLSDSQFNTLDILSLAKVFASALQDESFDLILSGLQSDDKGNSQLGILLAELLNMSHASLVMGTEVQNDKTIKVKRELESGWFQWTTLSLPASISIQSGINTPRYASLRGIMMMKKKPINTITKSNLEIDVSSLTTINKMYFPNKEKETKYIEGDSDAIVNNLMNVLKNDIKVL